MQRDGMPSYLTCCKYQKISENEEILRRRTECMRYQRGIILFWRSPEWMVGLTRPAVGAVCGALCMLCNGYLRMEEGDKNYYFEVNHRMETQLDHTLTTVHTRTTHTDTHNKRTPVSDPERQKLHYYHPAN